MPAAIIARTLIASLLKPPGAEYAVPPDGLSTGRKTKNATHGNNPASSAMSFVKLSRSSTQTGTNVHHGKRYGQSESQECHGGRDLPDPAGPRTTSHD